MENNEICMCIDVKLDIYDKRPDSLRFKQWTRCQVKIEAVKCVPCFLRLHFQPTSEKSKRTSNDDATKNKNSLDDQDESELPRGFSVSINVPGVSISLASSRTKQHSYGLFWTQNRRNCFIYFALETGESCRKHMKWLKKSIKNLELHRQIFLEQRRLSRGPSSTVVSGFVKPINPASLPQATLKPLPQIPGDSFNGSVWSQRVSEIYEEIAEGSFQPMMPTIDDKNEPSPGSGKQFCAANGLEPRLSRRVSNVSIASGIYEEMNPAGNISNFDLIREDAQAAALNLLKSCETPPPPLPPPRKRLNTFQTDSCFSESIPRSNTNPESDLARKKKYKLVLDNIFHSGGLRTKRTVSVSEGQASCAEDLISNITPRRSEPKETYTPTVDFSGVAATPTYANQDVIQPLAATAKRKKLRSLKSQIALASEQDMNQSKRNSFSSPDLSKINFLDTFDEERVADLLFKASSGDTSSENSMEIIDLHSASLDESAIVPESSEDKASDRKTVTGGRSTSAQAFRALMQKRNQLLNVSQQISNKFNYSACNSSSINLVGADSANTEGTADKPKQSIVIDDLTGYCLMAPIVKKEKTPSAAHTQTQTQPLERALSSKPRLISTSTESTSSGYSTGGCSSYASSTTSNEEQRHLAAQSKNGAEVVYENVPLAAALLDEDRPLKTSDSNSQPKQQQQPSSSLIYENLTAGSETPSEFTQHLYENLLTVKASQELEQTLFTADTGPSTSTPTDSPLMPKGGTTNNTGTPVTSANAVEENFYQTPRRSIISVDDKIPSYYPNTADTVKMRRRSRSPSNASADSTSTTPTAAPATTTGSQNESSKASTLRRLMSSRRTRAERKESLDTHSPKHMAEQPTTSGTLKTTPPVLQRKKKATSPSPATAQRIAENIYSVTHRLSKKSMTPTTSIGSSRRSSTKSKDSKSSSSTNSSLNVSNEINQHFQSDLLQLEILKSIDFKFEDTTALTNTVSIDSTPESIIRPKESNQEEQQLRMRATTVHVMTPKHVSSQNPKDGGHEEDDEVENTEPIDNSAADHLSALSPSKAMAMSKSTNCSNGVGILGSIQTNNLHLIDGVKKFASLPRFRKFDLSPLKMRINNVLQRNNQQQQ